MLDVCASVGERDNKFADGECGPKGFPSPTGLTLPAQNVSLSKLF